MRYDLANLNIISNIILTKNYHVIDNFNLMLKANIVQKIF